MQMDSWIWWEEGYLSSKSNKKKIIVKPNLPSKSWNTIKCYSRFKTKEKWTMTTIEIKCKAELKGKKQLTVPNEANVKKG